MGNHSNNSRQTISSNDAPRAVPNASASRDPVAELKARPRVRKKVTIRNPSTRTRHRSEKYEALRRSQTRMGWAIAISSFVGIGIGLFVGYVAVGAAAGLIVGLALGLIISG